MEAKACFAGLFACVIFLFACAKFLFACVEKLFACALVRGCEGYFASGIVFLMLHLEMWFIVTIFADDDNSLFKIRKELL